MNIWLSLDKTENESVNEVKSRIRLLTELSGIEYEYYFKVYPSAIGTKVVFVCESLSFEKDVTNYNNW